MIDQYIYTFLGAQAGITNLTSTRIYPDHLPSKPTYDAVTFRGMGHDYTSSYDGQNGHVKSEYYFDAWSSTHAGAITLANAIRTELKGYSGTFGGIDVQQVLIDSGPFIVYEESVEAYRATQIFSIWHLQG